jgi:hypothetical protein
MTIQPVATEKIAEIGHAGLVDYAQHWLELAGEQLRSLVLYGPVVSGQLTRPGMLAHNVAVLAAVDLELLRQLARQGPRFAKRRIAAPIIMTPDYIRQSLDTFPLELIEIQRHHVTVYGEECFEDLIIEAEHVRLQCERELKILQIGMRQGLLAAAGKKRLLSELETTASESLLRTIRGLLWLKGEKELDGPEDLLLGIEQHLGHPFNAVRAIVQSESAQGWDQFVALYEDLDILREKADAW